MVELAAVINQLADGYRRLERDLDAKSADARARVEEERNRFAALMSELSEGVVVCNADGRILLYNARAAKLVGSAESGPARGDYTPLGLGRSVFGLLERDQVAHALDKIHQQLERNVERPHTRFVTGAANGAVLRVQVAPFLSADRRVAGMVFTLDDVSGLIGREGQRLKLLQALATGMRAPVANLRAVAESLVAFPDMEVARRVQFVEIVAAESRVLTERLNTALSEYADALKGSLTLEDMRVVDLADRGAAARDGGHRDADADRERGRGSVGEGRQLRGRAGDRVARRAAARRLRRPRAAVPRGGERPFRRARPGLDRSDRRQRGARAVGNRADADRRRRDAAHAEGRARTSWRRGLEPGRPAAPEGLVPVPPAAGRARRGRAARPAPTDHRPEYYDFDLFEHIETTGALAEHRLAELSYTVFDTETTGLEPSAGDEIISIGAVRIVNGRLLKNEVFEQLVNPLRPIAREATRIHGIDGRALAGQPPIAQVLPGFHRFCEDTVLVAHNAAFDMRFLELKEAATGVRFGQPVLDTLLLSAVVHPSFENHHLDTIAERLGVRVIGRHTALGDALVTGRSVPEAAAAARRPRHRHARPGARGLARDVPRAAAVLTGTESTMAETDNPLERRLAGEHQTLARPLRTLVRRPPVVCGEAARCAKRWR